MKLHKVTLRELQLAYSANRLCLATPRLCLVQTLRVRKARKLTELYSCKEVKKQKSY